jgi:hypothetical protein
VLEIIQRKVERVRAVAYAMNSGLMFSIANFWTGPWLGFIVDLVNGVATPLLIVVFVIVCVVATVTNAYGIILIQLGFKTGNASLLVPIQYFPVQVTPAIVYLIVFALIPPSAVSLGLFICGMILVIASSFILTRRQVLLEKTV